MSRRSNRWPNRSKYLPHQGVAEKRRRLRQVNEGLLEGADGKFVTVDARYAASGLIAGTTRLERF